MNHFPLAPVKIILHNAQWDKNGNPDTGFYFKMMFNLYEYPWSNRYFGIFYYLVLPSITMVLIKDVHKTWPVLFWLLFYFAFLQWIGPWLAGRTVCERMERFLIPLGIPASLLTARAIGIAWQRGTMLKNGVIILLVIVAVNLLWTTAAYAYPSEIIHLYRLKTIAGLVPKLIRRPVYLDFGSADKLRSLTGYEFDIRGYPPDQTDFTRYTECWVVFDTSEEAYIKGWIKRRRIPRQWIKAFRFKAPLVSHFGNFDAFIYFVP